tara:strand:- start:1032 stop:1520 length:489 start_codon:yes stop_codon:yes gene_type:complete
MKKNADEYLFNEAVKYLGKYPATKKKIKEYLQKKIKNKKTYSRAIFPEGIDKDKLIEDIVDKLDELKIINEDRYLDSMFNYYEQSLFSIKKIKNKLYQKGFDQKSIDEYISGKLYEDPDFELEILKKYIKKKKISNLELSDLKKKLYQQSFSENSIYKLIRE